MERLSGKESKALRYDAIYSRQPIRCLLPIYPVGGCGAAWSKDEPLKAFQTNQVFAASRDRDRGFRIF